MKKKSDIEKEIAALPPNPRKARKWTLEEDAMILKYAEEKGSEPIARVLGLGGNAVRRRLVQLKATMKGK